MERLKQRCVEYNVLERIREDLCNILPINRLFPSMISDFVINFKDKEEICAERTQPLRVQYFLEHFIIPDLDKGKEWDTNRFDRFLAVMKQSSRCDELVKKIEYWKERYKDHSAKPDETDRPFVEG